MQVRNFSSRWKVRNSTMDSITLVYLRSWYRLLSQIGAIWHSLRPYIYVWEAHPLEKLVRERLNQLRHWEHNWVDLYSSSIVMKHSTSRLWAVLLLGFVRLELGATLEFNRLEERMLSACSQQILVIQTGIREKLKKIELMGKDVNLSPRWEHS